MVEPAYSDERAKAFRAYMCLYGYKAAIDRCDWVAARRWFFEKEGEMQSMDKDGATVVDMVADWLEENGYDGMTDGRCSCTGGCLMHCGLVRSRRCSAAHLFPCTRCTHLTTCDRTTGADVYSTDANWCGEFEEA